MNCFIRIIMCEQYRSRKLAQIFINRIQIRNEGCKKSSSLACRQITTEKNKYYIFIGNFYWLPQAKIFENTVLREKNCIVTRHAHQYGCPLHSSSPLHSDTIKSRPDLYFRRRERAYLLLNRKYSRYLNILQTLLYWIRDEATWCWIRMNNCSGSPQ